MHKTGFCPHEYIYCHKKIPSSKLFNIQNIIWSYWNYKLIELKSCEKNKQKARKTTTTKREPIYHKKHQVLQNQYILRNSQNCQVYGLLLLFIECTTHRLQISHSSYLFSHSYSFMNIQGASERTEDLLCFNTGQQVWYI